MPRTLLMGFIAGITILLGVPIGRLRKPMPGVRLVLTSMAIGVLIFLVWDVLSAAWEPVDAALSAVHEKAGGLGPVFGYGSLFVGGLSVGLLSLVGYDKVMNRVAPKFGPGAMSVSEHSMPGRGVRGWSPMRRLSLLIAVGIGLHNFAEGLAIGQSAAQNEIGLATILVIGFGLHNATEGFGIVAPLAADFDEAGNHAIPSWRLLFVLATIGGAPTFLGAALGHAVVSDALSITFLTLAAGSILYVVVQLLNVALKARRNDLLMYGLLLGILAGFITDAVVTMAGV